MEGSFHRPSSSSVEVVKCSNSRASINDPVDVQPRSPPRNHGNDNVVDSSTAAVAVPNTTIDLHAINTTAMDTNTKLIRLLRTGLVANIFLFLGGLMYVAFYARELLIKWWTRDVAGDVLYLIGFSGLFLSGIVELWIDVVWSRDFGHGRYTTKKRTNIFITTLFLLGNIGDLIAFIFWRQGREGLRQEHLTQWFATHIYLLTAVLVLVTNRPKYVPFQNRLDAVANVFFFCEAILACCARYVSTVGDIRQNQVEIRLELASAVFWMINAIFYILADLMRLQNPGDIV